MGVSVEGRMVSCPSNGLSSCFLKMLQPQGSKLSGVQVLPVQSVSPSYDGSINFPASVVPMFSESVAPDGQLTAFTGAFVPRQPKSIRDSGGPEVSSASFRTGPGPVLNPRSYCASAYPRAADPALLPVAHTGRTVPPPRMVAQIQWTIVA